MDYADESLELAQEIANPHARYPRQSSLRRAVSTAYYALFHLLISEATSNWSRPELRAALGPERTVAFHPHNIADTFVETQYFRNDADYNTVKEWELDKVLTHLDGIAVAFKSWRIIRRIYTPPNRAAAWMDFERP